MRLARDTIVRRKSDGMVGVVINDLGARVTVQWADCSLSHPLRRELRVGAGGEVHRQSMR